MKCPKHDVEMIKSETQYGDRWDCPKPDCTVASWDGETSTPADAETREARKQAHEVFDPLWKKGEFDSRSEAYEWLSLEMGIAPEECHIGMFDYDQCHQAILLVTQRRMKSDG